ncbi:MAG: pyridoxal-phosphate dependent enzyme [Acidobacteriota bacterium]
MGELSAEAVLGRVPDREVLELARERLLPHIHRTPVLTSSTFDELCGARLYFKAESFQKAGSFKVRGALNTVLGLNQETAASGVVTHSSGNHGQAVALAAQLRGIPAVIVMPNNAPMAKQDAVRGYGAEVQLCPPTLADRERSAAALVAQRGLTLVHPYDDPRILAGQSTCARELMEDAPERLDWILAPVGGGGLISGSALAASFFGEGTRVLGVEPAGADDSYRSLRDGELERCLDPRTVADGLRTSLGKLPFKVLRQLGVDVVTVKEETIVEAMRLLWERLKVVVEPSGAVPLAALMEDPVACSGGAPPRLKGKAIGVVLSGGNLDLARLPWQS